MKYLWANDSTLEFATTSDFEPTPGWRCVGKYTAKSQKRDFQVLDNHKQDLLNEGYTQTRLPETDKGANYTISEVLSLLEDAGIKMYRESPEGGCEDVSRATLLATLTIDRLGLSKQK